MKNFEGTILEESYNPIFLDKYDESCDIEFKYDVSSQKWCVEYSQVMSQSPILGSILSIGICAFAFNSRTNSQSIFDSLTDIFDFITYSSERKKIEQKFHSFVMDVQKSYEEYCQNHESILQNMKTSVQIINKKKVLMKSDLQDLHNKLEMMGINSNYTEVVFEDLDLRKFPLNEEYDIIKNKQLENKVKLTDFWGHNFTFSPVLSFAYNFYITKKLKSELEELKPIQSLIQEKMATDLKTLSLINAALDNVSKIFSAVHDQLHPIFVSLLNQLVHKYSNDFSSMPQSKVTSIQKIKDLFKLLSEVVVVPNDVENMYESIRRYSNDLSHKYNDLRSEIFKMAA